MIEVKNISKSFNGREVLKGIDFEFQSGKTNLVIGKSGSGKSVLVKCIVGLIEPTSGEVIYDRKSFTKMDIESRKNIRKEIGMLFQGGALFDSQTVEENIKFPLRMHSKMSEKEMTDRVNFCLDRVSLHGVNERYPAEISGGMQKRVGIARAIVLKPKYLFCDEPNSGLDPQTAIVIDNLIQEITHEYKMTTIVVTHDMNSVLEIGENILFIHEGKKHWEGNKNVIFKSKEKELLDFVFASDLMKKLKEGEN